MKSHKVKVAFGTTSIILKCLKTYLSSFLLYLIWRFAHFYENDGIKDQILRKAVPALVFMQNWKLFEDYNDEILFDQVIADATDETNEVELMLEESRRAKLEERAALNLRLFE